MKKSIKLRRRLSYKALTKPIKTGELPLPDGYEMPMHHGHMQSFKTIRKATYRRKDIRVETTYKIKIDNEPLRRHTMVLDDGTVHCHDFPNYSFPSAIDMVKKIVDSMIEFDAPKDELTKPPAQKHKRHKKAAPKRRRTKR